MRFKLHLPLPNKLSPKKRKIAAHTVAKLTFRLKSHFCCSKQKALKVFLDACIVVDSYAWLMILKIHQQANKERLKRKLASSNYCESISSCIMIIGGENYIPNKQVCSSLALFSKKVKALLGLNPKPRAHLYSYTMEPY